MKKAKPALVIAFAATLLITLAAGCSGKKSSDPASSNTQYNDRTVTEKVSTEQAKTNIDNDLNQLDKDLDSLLNFDKDAGNLDVSNF